MKLIKLFLFLIIGMFSHFECWDVDTMRMSSFN